MQRCFISRTLNGSLPVLTSGNQSHAERSYTTDARSRPTTGNTTRCRPSDFRNRYSILDSDGRGSRWCALFEGRPHCVLQQGATFNLRTLTFQSHETPAYPALWLLDGSQYQLPVRKWARLQAARVH